MTIENVTTGVKMRETEKWSAFVAAYPRQAALFFEEDAPIKASNVTSTRAYYKVGIVLSKNIALTEKLTFPNAGRTAYKRFVTIRKCIQTIILPLCLKIAGKSIPSGKQLR